MQDYQPHVALGMEDVRHLLAHVELEVVEELVELVEELVELEEELVDAHVLRKSSLGLHREALLVVGELVGLGWLRLNLILGGLVAPQVFELLTIVVLDVVPRHLVHLVVVMLALPLRVGVGVAVLVLAQK